jgi:hypothetical protein
MAGIQNAELALWWCGGVVEILEKCRETYGLVLYYSLLRYP